MHLGYASMQMILSFNLVLQRLKNINEFDSTALEV